ncbi:MAG: MlaD family protein [Vulcanimicrobiaceae bacterium]
MSKQAQVGAFAIVAMLLLFGVFYVITDYGTRHTGYRIGVHFTSAAGLHPGALVYFSGVTVGSVDAITLLEDNTVDVVLAIRSDVSIPQGSKFLIQAPLTGDPSLLIVPPRTAPGEPNPPALDRQVLPVADQPHGTDTASIADLVNEGQGEVRKLDILLTDLEQRTPRLMDSLQSTMDNANHLTVAANASLASMQGNLSTVGNNFAQLSTTLNSSASIDSQRLGSILTQLNATSLSLNRSMNSIESLATNPAVHQNLIATTENIAHTTHTIALLTDDLQNVAGDPQTQAQLKNTIAVTDATMQKANSLLGELGATSNVYGVDAGATPAPVGSTAPLSLPTITPYPAVTPYGQQPATPPVETPLPGKPLPPTNPAQQQKIRTSINDLARSLVQIQLRMGLLNAQTVTCCNPLLTSSHGPYGDLNAIFLPRFSTSLVVGANDIGVNTTYNVLLMQRLGSSAHIGGGVLYSQLGVIGQYQSGFLGFDARLYQPTYPRLDLYANFKLLPGTLLFFGQRDVTHADRRITYGLQHTF